MTRAIGLVACVLVVAGCAHAIDDEITLPLRKRPGTSPTTQVGDAGEQGPSDVSVEDAVAEAARPESGSVDASPSIDSASATDASIADDGEATEDSSAEDTGTIDTGTVDTGAVDTGTVGGGGCLAHCITDCSSGHLSCYVSCATKSPYKGCRYFSGVCTCL